MSSTIERNMTAYVWKHILGDAQERVPPPSGYCQVCIVESFLAHSDRNDKELLSKTVGDQVRGSGNLCTAAHIVMGLAKLATV